MPLSTTAMLALNRTGLISHLQDLDGVSVNLANVNTIGYKSQRTNFQELLSNARVQGVRIQATQQLMAQGSLRVTTEPLNMAITGEGFFAVTLPDGRTAYTRDGDFKIDANNQLVTQDGLRLQWQGTLPATFESLNVQADGTVTAMQNGQPTDLGVIPLTRFMNPTGLQGYGGNMWLETDASGAPQNGTANANGYGTLRNYTLESANVNLSAEFTHLVTLQRAYSLSVRALQQTDHMLGLATQLRR